MHAPGGSLPTTMDHVISRYRNITVLVLVVGAQFLLLAYQVKGRKEMSTVRVMALTGFTPLARVMDVVRDNTVGLVDRYAGLLQAQSENDKMRAELDKFRLENQYLKRELSTAERGQALAQFRATAPHRTVAARVVGTSTAPGSRVVFVDRGAADGVRKGMAVMNPSGIVGRVTAVQSGGAQVMLITDSNFAAGVISEKSHVLGVVKGQGHSAVLVDYVQNEEPLEVGEMFFTSGDDGVFPKGLPVGSVKIARRGRGLFKEIFVIPTGLDRGTETVLMVLEGVHQSVPGAGPEEKDANPVSAAPGPQQQQQQQPTGTSAGNSVPIDADQVLRKYEGIGQAQGHRFGAGGVPNFLLPPTPPPPAAAAAPEKKQGGSNTP